MMNRDTVLSPDVAREMANAGGWGFVSVEREAAAGPVNLHPAGFDSWRDWFDALGIPAKTASYLGRLTVGGGGDDLGGGTHGPFTVTDEAMPGLVFELELANDGGVLSYTAKVSDDAANAGDVLTARSLRRVRVMDLALACRLHLTAKLARMVDPDDASSAAALVGWLVRPATPNPEVAPDVSRGREVTARQLAEMMSGYLHLLKSGVPPGDIAAQLGCSPSKLADWKRRARDAGLFEGRGHGRPGGHLTEAGLAALAD